MRLICPNCDAQYEVADDVIPTSGRDVQCSNCGKTWYQLHPDHMPEVTTETDAADGLTDLEENEAPAPAAEPVRRALDPTIADILRQEAKLESKARAEAAGTLESQPDLGLENHKSGLDEPKSEDRTKRPDEQADIPKARQVSEPVAKSPAIGSRRDLLPDIEEINSTLRSTSDRKSGTAEGNVRNNAQMPKEKSGFGRGFSLMILLAVVLVAIYHFAPEIAQSIPQADPYISAFVAQADTGRSWLDGQVANLLTWLDTVATAETSE